jgi:hypothetical protein
MLVFRPVRDVMEVRGVQMGREGQMGLVVVAVFV